MDSIILIRNYESYLNEFQEVIKPELIPILDKLRNIDPHDLVIPDTWFSDENSAKGLVWEKFIAYYRKSSGK